METYFSEVTKGMGLEVRDPEYFNSVDLHIDVNMGSFCLFLEAFNKYLITSEFTWSQTEKIMSRKSLISFIVFLKNMLLSTYIQNYLMDTGSVYFDHTFEVGTEILSLMNDINDETPIIEKKYFKARSDQMDTLSNLFSLIPEMTEEQIIKNIEVLKKMPFCYPFEIKYYIFMNILRTLRSRNMQYSELQIQIRRDHLVEDSIKAFKELKGNHQALRGTIKICFIDQLGTFEAGIDSGGILKEYLYDLAKVMLNPEYGLFVETKDRELDPNPESKAIVGVDHLVQYFIFGVIVGRAVYEEILIDSVFSKIMLRRMLGKPNFFNHLGLQEPEFYEQLKKVKNYEGDVSDFGLTFSVNKEGTNEPIELIRGGSNIDVNNENKIRYIYYLTHYYLNTRTREQSKAFLVGLNEIIPLPFLKMFSTVELQILISGEQAEINISDLQEHAQYSGGFFADTPYIKTFWDILRTFSSDDKVKFLKFVTNCSRPPIFGFRNLQPPFTIQQLESADGNPNERLPVASVCFNLLKLPVYTTPEILKTKLMQAINSGSGYYII